MNAISKVSEITAQDVADYLRIPGTLSQDETNYINTTIAVAKDYISKYTGIEPENIDLYKDFIIVVFVLCQDMYDTRALYIDKSNVNRVVDSILGLHQRNLL